MEELNTKNEKLANEIREEGNRLLKLGFVYDSLIKYNESLCNATPGGMAMALAYANRAAIYIGQKQYEKCLENICAALKSDYPESKMHKLRERQKECEKQLGKTFEEMFYSFSIKKPKETTKYEIKMNLERNPKIPYIADCIQLQSNEEYGYHLITTKDLAPGDVILVENYLYYDILQDFNDPNALNGDISTNVCDENKIHYQLCAFCTNSNLACLFPCFGCRHTMYCSWECQLNASAYHEYECEIYDDLVNESSFSVRSFFQALVICNHDIDELITLMKTHYKKDGPRLTAFDLDYTKMSEEEIKKMSIVIAFSSISNTRVKKRKMNSFATLLAQNSKTAEMMKTKKSFIMEFIGRMERVHMLNGVPFGKAIPKIGTERVYGGEAQCLVLSLLNHSCAPNVYRVQTEKKSFGLIVNQVINAGEQLFDCYNADFLHIPKDHRQEHLDGYGFTCNCIACYLRYPMFHEIETISREVSLAKYQFKLITTLKSRKEEILPEFISKLMQKCFNQLKELHKIGHKNMDIHADVVIIRESIYKLLLLANDCDKNLLMN